MESNPGKPSAPPTSENTSSGLGAAMTRATEPSGSITSIESDAGSRNSVESPRNGRMPPPREPYAFAVAGVVSATTAIVFIIESSSTTRRLTGSLTSSLPSGSWRTALTAPMASDVASAAPSGRAGGRADVCCASTGDAASVRNVRRAAERPAAMDVVMNESQ